jgi:LPXTG-motif cell wall-anchored protein
MAMLLLAAPLGALAQEAAPAAPAPAPAPATETTAVTEAPPAAPAQDEQPTGDLQEDESDVPQQYTDPFAGEDDESSGGQQGEEEAATPVTTAPVAQTTAGQLPQTGTPLSGIWIAGLLLLGAGAVMRFAARRREYPYPLPRY